MKDSHDRLRSISAVLLVIGVLAVLVPSTSCRGQCEVQDLEATIPTLLYPGFPGQFVIDSGWLAASSGASNQFAIGQLLLYRNSGSAWRLTGSLHFPETETDCDEITSFAQRFALNDDVAAASGQACDEQYVFVYRRTAGDWNLESPLPSATVQTIDWISNISIDGEWIALGDPSYFADGHVNDGGRVVLFQYDGSQWNFHTDVINTPPAFNEEFGHAVALQDDVLLVSAENNDSAAEDGGAVVFFRKIDGKWTKQFVFTPPNLQPSENFGRVFDLSGDVVIVGRREAADGDGRAYVLRDNGEAWVTEAVLEPDKPKVEDTMWFGSDVAASNDGNTVLVMAPWEGPPGNDGAVYVFQYQNGAWEQTGKVTPGPDENFGWLIDSDEGFFGTRVDFGTSPETALRMLTGVDSSDCNNNGTADACDIVSGTSADENADGVPDECQVNADIDGDGIVGVVDLLALLSAWGGAQHDLDGSGVVDVNDLLILLGQWGPASPAGSCSAAAGACCQANGSAGCADDACCQNVCAADPYCCETTWDKLCASQSQELCGCPSPATCGTADADCCVPGEQAGCQDAQCCAAVCAVDPYCCETRWDIMCAAEGQIACGCDPPPNEFCPTQGSCCEAGGIGCEDTACCMITCNQDPFCCEVIFDGICADIAQQVCEVCQ